MAQMKYVDEEYYHVFNRGAHKLPIFFRPANYTYCLELLSKYQTRYAISVLAYCLMPNHYHFVLRQEQRGSISKTLQTVFNAYTQAINLQQKHSGTLFQGRAKARHTETDAYVLQVIRYCHLNPVRAGLVLRPEDWEYSNYREWIGMMPNSSAATTFRDLYFSGGEEYRLFVEQSTGETEMSKIAKYVR